MEEVMKPATCPVYLAISRSWTRYLFTAKVIPDVTVTSRTSPMARGSHPDQKPAREKPAAEKPAEKQPTEWKSAEEKPAKETGPEGVRDYWEGL